MGLRECYQSIRELPREWRQTKSSIRLLEKTMNTAEFQQAHWEWVCKELEDPETHHSSAVEMGAMLGAYVCVKYGSMAGSLYGAYICGHPMMQSGSIPRTILATGLGAVIGGIEFAVLGYLVGAGAGAAAASILVDKHDTGSWRAGVRRSYQRIESGIRGKPLGF